MRVGALLLLFFSLAARGQKPADEWLAKPVDDRTFRGYLDFFVYDHQTPFDLRVIDQEEHEGVRQEHFSFQSTPGVKVFARFYRAAARPGEKRPAIIWLHGGAAAGKDGPAFKVFSPVLVRAGWDVLTIDLLYYGERSTDLFTTFTNQEKADRLYNNPSKYLAWITQTVKDVGRSFDLLVAQRGVDSKRIGLMGSSRGAIASAIAGGADRRLNAVVLLYGGHFIDYERGHLPAACPANYIGHISPRPLLMINGTQDVIMLKDTSVVPLQRLAKPPRQILWAETGHQALPQEYVPNLLQWLRENLK
jgi:dienelactone hydrolase